MPSIKQDDIPLAHAFPSDREWAFDEKTYRLLFDASPSPMWIYDRQTYRFLAVNPAAIEYYGYSREQFLAMTVLDIRPEEDIARFKSFTPSRDAGLAHVGMWRHRKANGEIVQMDISSYLLKSAEREVMVVTARDTVEVQRSREALDESAEKYRVLFEEARDAIFLMDAQHILVANRRTYELFGFLPGETLPTVLDLSPPIQPDGKASRESINEYTGKVLAGEPVFFLWRHIKADGSPFDVEVSLSPLRLEGRPLMQAVVRDVTARLAAEDELRRLSRAVEQCTALILITDGQGRIEYVNPKFEEVTGYTLAEVKGKNPRFLQAGVTPRQEYQELWRTLRSGHQWHGTFHNLKKSGEEFWERASISPVFDSANRLTHYIAVKEDITQQRKVDEALRCLAEEQAVLLDSLDPLVWYLVTPEKCGIVNKALANFLGRERADIDHRPITELFPNEISKGLIETTRKVFEGGRAIRFELRVPNHHGELRTLEITCSPFGFRGDGTAERVVCLAQDMTEHRFAEELLRASTLYDALTGLPNRTLLADRIGQALLRSASGKRSYSLLIVDVDRFNMVNESLGHMIGDQFLAAIAQRLSELVGPTDTLSRATGDEFLILTEATTKEHGSRLAEQVLAAFDEPLEVSAHHLQLTVSVGIVRLGADYTQHQEVLRDAQIALHEAKRRGRACHAFFEPHMRSHSVEAMALEQDLRVALRQHQFVPYFQAIVDLVTGMVVGFEVLVRWVHPTRGVVSPAVFIPHVEETGLIVPLEQRLFADALKVLGQWNSGRKGGTGPFLNLNVSPRHLIQPGLLFEIEGLLGGSGVDVGSVHLEILEGALQVNPESMESQLSRLKSLGVDIFIDDFGTGYSSLERLTAYPIAGLKIDRSFVASMHSPRHEALVKTIVSMASSLNLSVTAEGIETREQWKALRALGCQHGQGYLFSRPVPANEAALLLDRKFLLEQ